MHTATVLSVALCVLAVFLTSSVDEVQSSPVQYKSWEEYVRLTKDQDFLTSKDNECRYGGKMKNLCEKCAKVTKNEIVYPLCCRRRKNVTEWCHDFLNYKPDEPVLSV